MELEDVSPRWDVGDTLKKFSALGLSHPAYRKVSDLVTSRVDELARERQEVLGRSKVAVLVVNLPLELQESVYSLYPEFRVVNYSLIQPGHSVYRANQVLGNQWMLSRAGKYGSKIVHLGGSLLASLVSGLDVHLELSRAVPAAVHQRADDLRSVFRIFSDYSRLQKDTGLVGLRERYENYMRDGGRVCESTSCTVRGDVYLADLSLYPMSPLQVAVGALEAGATMCTVMFPYHPVMLVSDEGEIPGTGVWYVKDYDAGVLRLRYPDGVCGWQQWDLVQWASWLCEHTVDIGKGNGRVQFQLQLLKGRGPFMFADLVKVQQPQDSMLIRHALELPFEEPMYVVRGWQLRSLAVDPSLSSSWEEVVFTVPQRAVDSVYAFGMQLKPEAFSRYAIAQQLRRLDRITIEGTSVMAGVTLTLHQLETLTTMLHAELFVQRYQSGLLSSAMMDQLKRVSGFASASTAKRLQVLVSWTVYRAWDSTVGALVEGVSSLARWVEKYFSSDPVSMPTFDFVPKRIDVVSMVGDWKKQGFASYEGIFRAVTGKVPRRTLETRGGLCLAAVPQSAVQQRLTPVQVRSITSVKVRIGEVGGAAVEPVLSPEQSAGLQEAIFTQLSAVNEVDSVAHDRMDLECLQAVRQDLADMEEDQELDADFVVTLNDVYEVFNPGVAAADLDQDLASIAYDPQDRYLQADYLRIPRIPETVPKDREYFPSKVLALGAPKRQEIQGELLSATVARNLSAPKISLPQDESVLIHDVWEKFLDNMCIPGARDLLEVYRNDPVALEEKAYSDWVSKAAPNVLSSVAREIEESSAPVLNSDVGDYLFMLKADVKPPLSDKPLRSRVEPQVIVYHTKLVSSVYSAILRVLVRRFLSLLKPNVHVNLLKDLKDIRSFVQAVHPWEEEVKYLENDFSKYDKSQDAFVFKLEQFVFEQLGMNAEYLARWVEGHEDCRLRSFVTGMSLHLRFQRKSGDASTAFGNVLLNVLSTNYAYELSDYYWAVYMGDDSLMCVGKIVVDERAVRALAELFNLSAKTFLTDAPYFASTFFVMDYDFNEVFALPDPLKRIEKWSQPVPADDPQWRERWVSAVDACGSYKYQRCTAQLPRMIAERYPVSEGQAARLPSAIYSALVSEDSFRSMYHDLPRWYRY